MFVLMNRHPCGCHWQQDEEEADRQTEEDRGDCGRPGICGGQNHPPPSSERKSGVLPEVEGLHGVSEAVHFHICKRLRKIVKRPHLPCATVRRTRGNLRTTWTVLSSLKSSWETRSSRTRKDRSFCPKKKWQSKRRKLWVQTQRRKVCDVSMC